MKTFYSTKTIILVLISIFLAGCEKQSNLTSVICRPIDNPFSRPEATNDWVEYAPNIEIGIVCSFSGEVVRGQVYFQKISDDLAFCLRPNSFWKEDGGWDIVISNISQDSCGESYSGIVTPPFYGDNPIYIQGWQFRNEDNTKNVPENLYESREIRQFNFVLNQDDLETIKSNHNCATRNQCKDTLNQSEANNTIVKIPKSRGILTITKLQLGNLIINDIAWIDYMEFDVDIYLPTK